MKHAKLIKKLAKMGVYVSDIEYNTDRCKMKEYYIIMTNGVHISGEANEKEFDRLIKTCVKSLNHEMVNYERL